MGEGAPHTRGGGEGESPHLPSVAVTQEGHGNALLFASCWETPLLSYGAPQSSSAEGSGTFPPGLKKPSSSKPGGCISSSRHGHQKPVFGDKPRSTVEKELLRCGRNRLRNTCWTPPCRTKSNLMDTESPTYTEGGRRESQSRHGLGIRDREHRAPTTALHVSKEETKPPSLGSRPPHPTACQPVPILRHHPSHCPHVPPAALQSLCHIACLLFLNMG